MRNTLNKLETRIPPPAYAILTAALIWWLARLLPALSIIPVSVSKIGILLIMLGVSIDAYALFQFVRKGTTPNPLSPHKTNTIVISGLYRLSRNPMYLGLLISLAGWAIYQRNLSGLICLPLFVWLMNYMQIMPEEHLLKEKFGDSYRQYLSRVRRWI